MELQPSKKSSISKQKKVDSKSSKNQKNNKSAHPLWNPVVISIVFLYLLIAAVYFINSNSKPSSSPSLSKDSETLLGEIGAAPLHVSSQPSQKEITTKLTFVVGGEIDKEKLKQFAQSNYYELKSQLGIKNEFCIHFEDKDGKVIDISDLTNRKGLGVGNPGLEYQLINDEGSVAGIVTC